jgi:hypothetical protein
MKTKSDFIHWLFVAMSSPQFESHPLGVQEGTGVGMGGYPRICILECSTSIQQLGAVLLWQYNVHFELRAMMS